MMAPSDPPPDDVRRQLLQVDLVAFVQADGVALERAGAAKWVGLCPFHAESTPSFTVYTDPARGWFCYGCGVGGTAIDYVQRRRGCDFRAALGFLGLRPGPHPLWQPLPPREPGRGAPPVAPLGPPAHVYPYEDAEGRLRYEVLRYRLADGTKTFRQRRPDGRGSHIWNLQGVAPLLYHLPALLAADPATPVLGVEGEKDVEALEALGYVATCNSGGAGRWPEGGRAWLQGRTVVLLPDADAAGQQHMAEVAANLAGHAARVVTLDLPDLPAKGDVSDFLDEKGPDVFAATLSSALATAPDPVPPPAAAPDLRPVISINDPVQDVRDAVLLALDRANQPHPTLFQRGRALVRVVEVVVGGVPYPQIETYTAGSLRPRIGECAQMVRTGKRGSAVAADATHNQLEAILSAPAFPFPVLDGLTEVPVLRPDGTLHATPGYDPATRLIYRPAAGLTLPPVAARPSATEIAAARQTIVDDLLHDFPFTSPTERANAVALFLLPFVRSLIQGPTPLHLIESPTPGSGKSLLAEMLLYPALGGVGAGTDKTDEDDTRKWITSQLHQGAAVLWLDNVRAGLNNATLANALTSILWSDRILGSTAMFQAPMRCLWVATANNPVLSTEIARRTIRIRIDPRMDRPQLRTGFRHPDLRGWMHTHRGDLVWAGLTLAQAWVAAGRPPGQEQALGSYEEWTHILGGILACAGIEGFLQNLLEVYDLADTEGQVWRAFVTAWWEQHESKPVTTADLFPLTGEVEGFDLGRVNTERGQRIAFGRKLSAQRDRIYGVYRITHAGVEHKQARWALVQQGDNGENGGYSAPLRATPISTSFIELREGSEKIPHSPHYPPRDPPCCPTCGGIQYWSEVHDRWWCPECEAHE